MSTKNKNKSKPKRPRYSERGWIFVHRYQFCWSGILCCIGLILLLISEDRQFQHEQKRFWPSILAQPVKIESVKYYFKSRHAFVGVDAIVDYQYEVAGQQCQGRWFSAVSTFEYAKLEIERILGAEVKEINSLSKWKREYAPMQRKLKVFWNPSAPCESLIEQELDRVEPLFYYAYFFILLSLPFLVILPLSNFIVACFHNKGRKSLINLLRSVLPIGYTAKLMEVWKNSLKELEYKGEYDFYYSVDTHVNRFEPVSGFVSVMFPDDASIRRAKESKWFQRLSISFDKHLSRSALPSCLLNKFSYCIHNREEIYKIGESNYWR